MGNRGAPKRTGVRDALPFLIWLRSSVRVERLPVTQKVAGSSPVGVARALSGPI